MCCDGNLVARNIHMTGRSVTPGAEDVLAPVRPY